MQYSGIRVQLNLVRRLVTWIYLRHIKSYISIQSTNQVVHVHCGNCRTALMYPYGAPSVKCAICHYVSNTNNGQLPIPVHRSNGTANTGALPSTSTSMPQSQSQTVVVENLDMYVDSSGELVIATAFNF